MENPVPCPRDNPLDVRERRRRRSWRHAERWPAEAASVLTVDWKQKENTFNRCNRGEKMGSSPIAVARPTTKTLATTIEERLSQEIVIALVGPIGSGVSTAAKSIVRNLEQRFNYKVSPIIKLSDFIRTEAPRVGFGNIERKPLDRYITEMQNAGNALREQFGGDYLVQRAVERIYSFRKANGGYDPDNVPIPGRRAYVIDSLKNVEEVALLRRIYGDGLHLVGVFAPDEMRKRRLINNQIQKSEVERIIARDQGEVQTFGQKTRKIFTDADFFICNDAKEEELDRRLLRYLELLFDSGVHTPTRAEAGMYEASAAAANSACLSRQVGSAIVSARGELISIGWNDVPRFGGGLYTEDDQNTLDPEKKQVVDRDNRCFRWGGSICHNENRRNTILDDIVGRVATSGVLKDEFGAAKVREILNGTAIESLTEFSRSIHAEMEAILAVAREGRQSLDESTLYVTTYPCHNCARHIVASGIREVVYIEPYLKSLAVELHWDAVTEDPEDKSCVLFRQYDGVAPRNYLRLFRPSAERKKAGRLFRRPATEGVPILSVPLDAQTDYELKVIADLASKEQTA